MNIQENVSLAQYTTLKIGGMARYFLVARTTRELIDGIAYAKQNDLPVFVLGGGSNILLDDEGFEGLVVKIEIKSVESIDRGDTVEVTAGAGLDWDTFVADMVSDELYGLENLSLIPGTIGASVVQNIGAYGVEISSAVLWVEILNTETNNIETLKNVQCEFNYRNSIFKSNKHYIVTRVAYELKKKANLQTDYKDVAEYFLSKGIEDPTLAQVRNAIVSIRTAKLPDLDTIGTAGSFFKNPVISTESYKALLEQYPAMPSYSIDSDTVKVPLGWIIEHVCGMKGLTDGSVGTHDKQSLVIVSKKNATAEEVKSFAKKIINCVKEKTGIEIEREVEYINKK